MPRGMLANMRTLLRVLRLSVGLWSPSLVMILGFRDVAALSWLDRWEVRNHARDCARLGFDPMIGDRKGS